MNAQAQPNIGMKPVQFENPMGVDGFEFVEFAAPDAKLLHGLFPRLGFTPVAKHKQRKITLYRQGDCNFLVNEEPNSFAADFAAKHGPCACGFAIRFSKTGDTVREQALAKGGEAIGLFYGDYYAGASKRGGAWMSSFRIQEKLDGRVLPLIVNNCNFPKPAPGQPALLTFDDVTTMFHEFGHALHQFMGGKIEYPRLAGTNVPRDFVEMPSQFNEHWALYPTVFANYAKHYRTGEPMPKALVEKIKRSRTFNQGFATLEYVEAALLDEAWHTLPPGPEQASVDSFETAALTHFPVYLPEVPPRYRTSYFSHIWGGGYAANYYAYMWAEVLDDDAFAWFQEHGGLTRANGQRFRDMVLSRGGTEDMGAMYRAFRGRDPTVRALLEDRGLVGR